MSKLVQLTYSSVAIRPFSQDQLHSLLSAARDNNRSMGITGMLLYAEGSFFQVIEGEATAIERLFNAISHDPRHHQVTVIIKEPIAVRSFGDWTMGYADLTTREAEELLGSSEFLSHTGAYAQLPQGRARKLLEAFRAGRWRGKLSDHNSNASSDEAVTHKPSQGAPDATAYRPPAPQRGHFTFAYQPIVDVAKGTIFSHEALIRGLAREPAGLVLEQVPTAQMHSFDEQCRLQALRLAAHLGLSGHLNLNFLPRSVETSPSVISSLLQEIHQLKLRPEQIVIEILEREIINDYTHFNQVLNECRHAGVVFAIDDFGSGFAGLNMLAEFQPNLIKLDMDLIRDIHRKGPRQAIVRGILRTCQDLGIDIIAEGVESIDEYRWLAGEGITLFQGNLFAMPSFEKLTSEFTLP